MKLTKSYTTKLETTNAHNLSTILDAKLLATSPQRVVDYVSIAVDNLEATIARMKDAEKELKQMRADAESQIEVIKICTAEWLTGSGVEKLDGDIVSSIKVVKPNPEETLVITTNEDSLINQGYFVTKIDKTAIKNAIKDGKEIEGAEIRVTNKQESVTIYKKRGK